VRHQIACLKQPALLADVLALAAWSPLLATTLEQNPEYLPWLSRERTDPRVRTRDELKGSTRTLRTHKLLSEPASAARAFSSSRVATHLPARHSPLANTRRDTEELSNLADAILDYALSLARQDLDNRYGLPRRVDDRGRSATAEFCVIALGKLGSMELNYASDIDLVFPLLRRRHDSRHRRSAAKSAIASTS
jgi:glutamate-ammonia-ligase adenylyltransferase